MKNDSIKLVVSDGAPSRLLEKHSEARMRLAKLITHRNSLEEKLRHLVETGGKLQEAADAERHAAAALAALDAEEAREMAAWAAGPGGPMPVFDRTRREKLEGEVHAAAAQATAARKAAGENSAAQQRENAALKALEPQFAIVIAEVIAESVEPLMQDFDAENRALASKAARIQEAFATIRAVAESLGNSAAARPVFVINERLHERIRTMSDRAAPDGVNHRTPWMALAARLRADPLATLEA
jgi:DNA repair exonuclease SbcCD ATPase subunit